MRSKGLTLVTLAIVVILWESSFACEITYVPNPRRVVRGAALIVHAKAAAYVRPPIGDTRTFGVPRAIVNFEVLEVLKGKLPEGGLLLHAYLGDEDDFNDDPVPYEIARHNGRRGSCYANTYREGGQFLLLLREDENGYTPNWCPMCPVNEQITGRFDPWLRWVRASLAASFGDMARGQYR